MRYFILIILFAPTLLFSQSTIGFGIGGLTSTTNIEYNSDGINPDDFDFYEEMWGENFQFSLHYEIALQDVKYSRTFLRIAPTIITKRFIRSFDDIDNEFNDLSTTYFNLPILYKLYYWGVSDFRPYVFAGPSVGIMLSSSGEGNREIYRGNTSEFFKDIEFSLIGGLGIDIFLSDRFYFHVQSTYHYGISDVSASNDNPAQDGSDIDAVTRAISFQAGLSFVLFPYGHGRGGCVLGRTPNSE